MADKAEEGGADEGKAAPKSKKKLIIMAAAALLVLGGGGGADQAEGEHGDRRQHEYPHPNSPVGTDAAIRPLFAADPSITHRTWAND